MKASGQLSLQLVRPLVLACGGGLDSWVDLNLAIEEGLRPDAVVFCDVADKEGKDPGEWPETYRHLREDVAPLCRRHGIRFEWLDCERYPVRDARSLFDWLRVRGQLPVAGPNRICTIVAKVERFERWLDDVFPDQVVDVLVGFEAGEEARAENDPNAGCRRKARSGQARRHNRFLLMERGLCRCRCVQFCLARGLVVPGGSACVYCPYASRGDWQRFAQQQPEHFARVVKLEADKPPTKKGFKLSIMGFHKRKDAAGNVTGYRAPPLTEFIQGEYRARSRPCAVCGAAQRVTKAVGCNEGRLMQEAA